MSRYRFIQSFYVRRTDEFANIDPADPQDLITSLGGYFMEGTLDVDFSISKSITSNADTATITIHNSEALESFYYNKREGLAALTENFYDITMYQWWYEDVGVDLAKRQKNQAIFTGSLTDIQIVGTGSITDSSLELTLTAGGYAAVRTITNRKFAKGITYRVMVEQLLAQYTAYDYIIDDPNGKLNKPLKKARTVHTKTSEILNTICQDLEMTWGFDAALLNVASVPADITTARKTIYFVDKVSTFDTLYNPTKPANLNYGIGPHFTDGGTGKTGRIGYSKSQFSFTHLTDPALNIGRIVEVTDHGTMVFPSDAKGFFKGRINRMTINNNTTSLECSHLDDNDLAILNDDKNGSGSLIL